MTVRLYSTWHVMAHRVEEKELKDNSKFCTWVNGRWTAGSNE